MENLNNTIKWEDDDEVQSDLFKFEKVGDSVEGVLLDVRETADRIKNDGSKVKIYEIQTADGEVKAVFGRKIIDQKMKLANIGDMVKMVFSEQSKPQPGRKEGFKMVKVFVKKVQLSEKDEIAD